MISERGSGWMAILEELLRVKIIDEQLTAHVWYNEKNTEDISTVHFTKEELKAYLARHRIVFGLEETNLDKIVEKKVELTHPIIVAKGIAPQHGEDGTITYTFDMNPQID